MPTSETESFSSPVRPEGDAQDGSEERAGVVRSESSAEDVHFEPQVGDKRKHSDTSVEHSANSGPSGQSLHVEDTPSKGALTAGLAL